MLPIDFKTKSQIKKIHKKSHQHWWGHHQPQSRSCIRLHHINPACKAVRSASCMAHPSHHPQPCSGTPCCWMLEFCWRCCCWVAVFYPVDTAIHYRAHGSVTTSHLLSAPYVKPVGRAESLIFLRSAPTFFLLLLLLSSAFFCPWEYLKNGEGVMAWPKATFSSGWMSFLWWFCFCFLVPGTALSAQTSHATHLQS